MGEGRTRVLGMGCVAAVLIWGCNTPTSDVSPDVASPDDTAVSDAAAGGVDTLPVGSLDVSAEDTVAPSDAGAGPEVAPAPDAGNDVERNEAMCLAYCEGVYDEAQENYCAPETALRAYWPEQSDCAAACMEMVDDAQRMRFIGCVYGARCETPQICETPPSEDYPECVEACGAIFDLCGQLGAISDPESCPALCTGLFMHYFGLNPEVGACIELAETCEPGPADMSFNILFECMVVPLEVCGPVCESIVACVPEEDGLTQEDCEAYCNLGGLGEPDAVAACIEQTTSCEEVFPCTDNSGASSVPPLCSAMCGKLENTCGLPSFACQEGCAAEMEPDSAVSAAGKICVLVADCGQLHLCENLDLVDPPWECEDACQQSPNACGELPGGCIAACQGLVAARSELTSQMTCIMDAVGDGCELDALGACF